MAAPMLRPRWSAASAGRPSPSRLLQRSSWARSSSRTLSNNAAERAAERSDMTTTAISEDLKNQRKYAEEVQESGFDFGLTVADAFVRGIRDIGYRNTARAIDELIDNSIQAEARNIAVEFGFSSNSDKKPTAIAVVD